MPKKQKRKLHVGRLLTVAVLGCVLIASLCYGTFFLVSKLNQKTETVLDEQEVSMLNSMADDINLAYTKINLQEIKYRIEKAYVLEENYLRDLKTLFEQYFEQNDISKEDISWAVQDLSTDVYIESENATEDFVAASTYKLPLLMLWCEKIAKGEVTMDTTFQLTKDMLEKEDEENPEQPIGKKYNIDDMVPLYELLQAASIYSDNLAGHMLFANIGGYKEYKTLAQKFSDTKQSAAFTDDKQNVLNAHYTMNLAHYLYTTPDVFDDLKYWLMLGGYGLFLNKNNQLNYIQKLGNIDEVRNVIGYYPGEFPFSISIYSRVDKDRGEQIIADLGDITYSYFQNLYNSGFYNDLDVRDHVYAYWELDGNTPGNVFWGFDFETPNKANSKENIAAVFGSS